MTPDEIGIVFHRNLERVQTIIGTYTAAVGPRQGRPSVADSDLLRAAVVLLHASLEDLLRMMAQERLPTAAPELLATIPLPVGTQRKQRFDLAALALPAYRSLQVQELIDLAVREYLERANYNHPGDIRSLLEQVELDPNLLTPYSGHIGAMNSRRHLIVHRADVNDATGRGHHPARSLARQTVKEWLTAVEQFGEAVIGAL